MGPTQPPVTASRAGPLCVEFVQVMRNDHGGVAHHALPGYPPAPSTAVALLGGNGPRPASALSSTVRPCRRVVRPRPALCRLPAQSRPSSTRPRTGGRRTAPCGRKDHEARTHTAACTTGPVSHTDGNQPATTLITSFLAISGPCLLGSSLASMGRVECAPECPDRPDRGQY